MGTAVRVLILDEPTGLHTSFRSTIEHTPALCTISEADLRAGGDHERTVVLFFMDDTNREAALERVTILREGKPSLRILVAFRVIQAADMAHLISRGADAFVGRGTSASEICRVILALADDADLSPAPAADPDDALDSLGLTRREAEVLRFLSAGFSNKDVARRLQLSVRTVETHRLNLRRKTQTGRLKDLVSLARQIGLQPVSDREIARGVGRH